MDAAGDALSAPAHLERSVAALTRLLTVMATLRAHCPWDAQQTHRSLLKYLVEEACEVVDAVESGTDADLVEELGDVLLQVAFHSEIAAGDGRFSMAEVADGICDKLVRRHPHVFAAEGVPEDMDASWEARKRAEKQRSSALEGIPTRLSALTRAEKVVSRARSHGVDVALADDAITADEVGATALDLVARAQACGVDPEQAVRDALRALESRIAAAESPAG